MASINLHDKPFTEETITKLEIFEDYAQAWLPTFVMQKTPLLCVFDFFAGTGYDKSGVAGSPIRLLEKTNEQLGIFFANKVKVQVYLNEFEPNKKKQEKFDLLKLSCEEYLNKFPRLRHIVKIEYRNEDFETLFPKLLPTIKKYPALVYLDQNGIKFTSDKYFLELEKTSQTDFLYFISSSYFWRFGDQEEFKTNLDINMAEAKKNPYKFIHNSIIEQLRKRLPLNSKLRLYPFSLKKSNNIHGIIFGASHPRAVDKFLTIAWDRNDTNGQANFDIFDHALVNQIDLFSGTRGKSRIEVFQEDVKNKILKGEITDNFQLYDYSINEGFLGRHSMEVVKKLKKDKLIDYIGSWPLINYQNVYKQPKRLIFTITK
ncbi:three-Cys-motif partner protein TcmP [Mucilaginibacter sp. CSA2-8R]|uniref:three-Cys-motif partner protein TcmP n=1 Tax=Mucilaginibacter sp. CSA2-8R TaxID=3141542 RepID=UPI00315D8C59